MLQILGSALGFPATLTLAFIAGPVIFWIYISGLILCLGLVQSRREAHDPRYAAYWRKKEVKG